MSPGPCCTNLKTSQSIRSAVYKLWLTKAASVLWCLPGVRSGAVNSSIFQACLAQSYVGSGYCRIAGVQECWVLKLQIITREQALKRRTNQCCIRQTDSSWIPLSTYFAVRLSQMAGTVVGLDASVTLHGLEPLNPAVTACNRVPSVHMAATAPIHDVWSVGVIVQFATWPLHAELL